MKKTLLYLCLILMAQSQNKFVAQDIEFVHYDSFDNPNMWVIDNTAGTTGLGWEFTMDPEVNPNPSILFASTTVADGFLFVSSDANNTEDNDGTPIRTTATTNYSLDFSDEPIVFLYFEHFFAAYLETRSVEVSGDNGQTWTEFSITTDQDYNFQSENSEVWLADISSIAGNQSQVKIRFTYDDNDIWAYFWAVDDLLIFVPTDEPTGLACYETAEFNEETLLWEVIGEMPLEPTDLACYEEAVFDEDFCEWYVISSEPTDLACYEEAVFDEVNCEWSVIGEMPEVPTDLACYEEAVFDEDLCEWYGIGEDTTPEAAVVTESNGTLIATGGSAGMGLWVDCSTQQPIAGAMDTTFTPTANGFYTYVILNATMTCFGIGNCVEVGFISLDEKDEVLFSIAPNPSNGIFTLKNPSLIDGVIVITDGSGRIIYESSLDASEKSIDISNASLGIYYLNIKSENNNKVIRIIKN